jgi:serine/threonine-protein kinase
MTTSDDLIAGRYRIERRLGAGGMGEVFLVRHLQLDEPRALKRMRPEAMGQSAAIERFRREARQHSRVRHPNVVTLYDFEELPDGGCYLVMEYVEGRTLESIRESGPLALSRALGIIAQTASAIDAAHEVGVVHRDLKPDNILITIGRDGGDRVKVVDFGVAVLMADEGSRLTSAGFVVGTPRYMSPEQLLPTPGEPLDGRSDVYSLALIAWELLVGAPAFNSDTLAAVMQRAVTSPPAISAAAVVPPLPSALDAVFHRALAVLREDRYPSATAFAEALIAVLVSAGAVAPQAVARPTPWEGAAVLPSGGIPAVVDNRAPVGRGRARLAGAVATAGLVALGWWALRSRTEHSDAPIGSARVVDSVARVSTAPTMAPTVAPTVAPTTPAANASRGRPPGAGPSTPASSPGVHRMRSAPIASGATAISDSALGSLERADPPSSKASALARIRAVMAVAPSLRTAHDSMVADLLAIEAMAQLEEDAAICARLTRLVPRARGTTLEAAVTYWKENMSCPL